MLSWWSLLELLTWYPIIGYQVSSSRNCHQGSMPCHTQDCAACVRADSRFAPSQWEMVLLCKDVSHWLGTNLESALLCAWQQVRLWMSSQFSLAWDIAAIWTWLLIALVPRWHVWSGQTSLYWESWQTKGWKHCDGGEGQSVMRNKNYWLHLISIVTHLYLDKMAAILQMIYLDAFTRMKSLVFWLKFHWSLLLRVQLTIIQHWFR